MKARCLNMKFFLLISAFLLISHSMHTTSYADITPVSERTQQVQDAIVAAVPGIDSANDVSETHLAEIKQLDLRSANISQLKSGDFSGLTRLTNLNLYNNQLSSLPNGIFEGLTALTTLRLGSNTVDPMQITVTLEKVGEDQFKVVVPTGAPFDIVIPISATNGSVADSATSLTISKGSTESNTVTLSRTADTTAAVTANIGILPSLPQNHYGYTLSKFEGLPLEVISEVTTAPVVADDTTTTPVVDETPTNSAPVFADSSIAIRSIAENTEAGANIGTAISASDTDNDTLTYTLSGADAAVFDIESTSGQLKTKATLDYETKRIYTLTITASDGSLINTITVIISVIDRDDMLSVSTSLPVSQRTPQVRDAIVDALPDVSNANEVTDAHLATITALNLRSVGISGLKSGDFSGLTALTNLNLYGNMISSLPVGLFDGLTALTTLRLGGNLADPMPLIVSLKQVADNQFQAVIPAGAPFDVVVPVDALMITISQGSSTSTPFTVLSTPSIGALPSLPVNHFGYILAKSAVCNRTSQVADVIAAAVPGASDCHNVTEVDLATITSLNLSSMSITSLKTGDFAGMLSLKTLNLSGNQLMTLPSNIFEGMASLSELNLSGNTVSPVPLLVSLQEVGSNQIKAVMPTGAPFDIVLPITVANGSIGGTTLTISTGSVESSTQTITRTSGTTDAVTADIGTMPNLPSLHSGYGLVKSNQQPLEIFSSTNVAPVFTEGTTATRSIAVNTEASTNIGSPIRATDANNDILTYTLSRTDAAPFDIVGTTGQLQTKAALDSEMKTTYSVTITVSDSRLTDTISVTINIIDIDEALPEVKVEDDDDDDETPPKEDDDSITKSPPSTNNSPMFTDGNSTTRSVAENTAANTNIGSAVSASDADNDTLSYSLGSTEASSFSIDSSSGQLRTSASLDFETKDSYSVTINVSDGNGGSDTISVTINITDIDETVPNNAPVFTDGSSTSRSVAENTSSGVNIGSAVSATDADNDTLSYSLDRADASSLSIDSSSGQLRTNASLDYETKSSYSVTVEVSDGKGGSDSISVTINVTDVDEILSNNAPVFTDGSSTSRSVTENTQADTNIGSAVSATDADDTLTYSLSGTNASLFDIVSSSGQLKTKSTLNHESKSAYSVTIIASDGSLTDSISVTINVTDVNEAPVFADGETTSRAIAENVGADINIGTAVKATEPDADDTLTYTLGGTDAASFAIDDKTGQLKTKATLDYEDKNTYSVTISVSDGNLFDSIAVTINVTDLDETPSNNPPIFEDGDSTTRPVAENSTTGTNIGTPISATDTDNNTLAYLLSGDDASSFDIVSTTGQLKTQAALNYEDKDAYKVKITVSDGSSTDTIDVTINVTDVNEAPVFADDSTTLSVAENTAANTNIGNTITATDPDSDELEYSLSGTDANAFSIDDITGQLKTKAALDYETKNAYAVTITASDGKLNDNINVTINITDIDENHAPAFATENTTRSVVENTGSGVDIGDAVSATDLDNDMLTYTLDGTDAASFSIDSTTGQLRTKAALDYETKTSYSVIITASDGKLNDNINVTINITDIDENHAPAFATENTTRSVVENTGSGVDIGDAVSATDLDNDMLTYTLDGTDAASFSIDSTTGQLRTKAALDYETKTSYSVTITASDGKLNDNINVTINITDIDENRAPAFATESTTRSVAENTAAGTNIGEAVSATDADNDTLTYTLDGTDAASFSIDSTTGQLRTKAALDYETKTSYSVTITASDGKLNDNINVTINITDIDENHAPAFATESTTRSVAENTVANTNIGDAVSATDPDDDALTYSLSGTDAASFGIVSTSGQLKTKAALDYETKTSYTFTVSVSDGNGESDSISVTINITDVDENRAPIVVSAISTDTLTAADSSVQIDVSGNFSDPDDDTLTYTASSDDTSVATVSVSGALVTITPEGTGDATITVTASDGELTATQTFSISVDADKPGVSITVPSGVENDEFDVTITFTEPVSGFEQSDVSVTGTASVTITEWSANTEKTVFTATITPTKSGIMTLKVDEGVATDAANNPNTASAAQQIEIDITQPDVSFSFDIQEQFGTPLSYITNGPFIMTIIFTEPVSGFEQSDLTLDEDYTFTDFKAIDAETIDSETYADTYTVKVVPDPNDNYLNMSIHIDAGSATDAAGNPNTSANSPHITIEKHRPNSQISVPDSIVETETFTVEIRFGVYQHTGPERALGFDQSDLLLTNNTAGATITDWSTNSGPSVFTAEITATQSGSVTFGVSENVATDLAGNGNTAAVQKTVTVTLPDSDPSDTSETDTTSPSISFSFDLEEQFGTPLSYITNGPFIMTIIFTEPVSGFEQSDLTLDEDYTFTDFKAIDAETIDSVAYADTYTVKVVPDPNDNYLNMSIHIDAGSATDAAGNPNTSANSPRITIEKHRPNSQISVPDSIVETETFTVEIRFGVYQHTGPERALGFDQSDLLLTNNTAGATITDWSTNSGPSVFTAEITATQSGSVTFGVPENAATDLAGNGNTAAVQKTVTVTLPDSDPSDTSETDTTSPSISFSFDLEEEFATPISYIANGPFVMTIIFTEPVSGFEQSDLTLDEDYTFTDFKAIDAEIIDTETYADTYTVKVIPDPGDSFHNMSFHIEAGVATDAAGNPNTSANSPRITVETHRPNVEISVPDSDVTTTTFTIEIKFGRGNARDDRPLGFDQSDLSLTNNTAGATITEWIEKQRNFQGADGVFSGGYGAFEAEITVTQSGTVTFGVPENVATDLAGNGNTAAVQKTVTITLTDNQGGAPLASVSKADFVLDPAVLKILDRDALQVQLEILRTKSDGSPKYLRTIRLIESILATMRPDKTQLLANYPNPFNPETWIPYHLANPGDVTISIYDARGIVVRRLELGHQLAGYYTSQSRAAHWDGTNNLGECVTSGIYFYQLQSDNMSYLRKMIILK